MYDIHKRKNSYKNNNICHLHWGFPVAVRATILILSYASIIGLHDIATSNNNNNNNNFFILGKQIYSKIVAKNNQKNNRILNNKTNKVQHKQTEQKC